MRDVLRWARAGGFNNVAATLPEAVALTPVDEARQTGRRRER